MRMGNCKECSTLVRLRPEDKLPNHDVWECPECGHPHAPDEFIDLRVQGAETNGDLIEQLKAFPLNLRVRGYWEGITRDVQNIVVRNGFLLLDVDDSPSTLEHE